MPSSTTTAAIVGIVIVILVGAMLGFFYGIPSNPNPNLSSYSSSASTTLSSATSSSLSSSSYSSSSASTSTSTSSSSSSSTPKGYSLQLLRQGSGPVVYSPMNTTLSKTYFPADGICCGGTSTDVINYTDSRNDWVLQGDINPGLAWASANSSGLTISYQSCADTNNLTNCGPHHEYWGDKEPMDDTSLYLDLGGIYSTPPGGTEAGGAAASSVVNDVFPLTLIPNNATVFSVDVFLPYHSYYASCQQDMGKGGPGCTYEEMPYDSATLGFDVWGNYDVVSIAQVCNNPCTTNALQMRAYTSQGGASVVRVLNVTTVPTYTPLHRLTIATDRKTFIYMYVDNYLLYSNSIMPIQQDLEGFGMLELSLRTSINNETSSATFSNLSVYSSPYITVSGLSSGMFVVANNANGFSTTAFPSSNGTASVIVALQPSSIVVSVESNEKIVATYQAEVEAGSVLELVTS